MENFETVLDFIDGVDSKLLAKLANAVAEVPVEFLSGVFEDVDLVIETANEKLAAVPGYVTAGGGLKSLGLVMGGAIATALGTALATDLFDAAKRGFSKSKNFQNIMASNPDLAKAGDRTRLKAVYDSLHRYAPDFTADPLMGGAILRNLIDSPPGTEPRTIGELIKYRKELIDSKNNQFRVQGKADAILPDYKEDKTNRQPRNKRP